MGFFRKLLGTERIELRRAVIWQLVDDPSAAAGQLLTTIAARRDDEIATIAARECRRRQPPVRPVVARPERSCGIESSVVSEAPTPTGRSAFDQYFEKLEGSECEGKSGIATLGLPATTGLLRQLRGKLHSLVPGERSKAIHLAIALEVVKDVDEDIYHLAHDLDPTVRADAIAALSLLPGPTTSRILRSALNDLDDRVQANAIEVLDGLGLGDRLEAVAEKLDSVNSRVRANAVKALLGVELHAAAETLVNMLEDRSSTHRISALWVVERLRLRTVLHRIHELSRADPDERVRRRAGRLLSELVSVGTTGIEPAADPHHQGLSAQSEVTAHG